MKMGRLFEMLYILMERQPVTAAELAQHFEVSARTIYRDVDMLSAAGIPVYTAKGKNGGIYLLEGFVLNRSLLSEQEQNEILTALQGLGVTHFTDTSKALQKLGALFHKNPVPWIDVDFSDWSHADRESFEHIKQAILENRILSFDYYSSYGEKTIRTIEPTMLRFKHKSWYLNGFDIRKQAERLFKLSRIKRLTISDASFPPRTLPAETCTPPDKRQAPPITILLKVDASQLYRVYDEFDDELIWQDPDGTYFCEATFPEDEWVYGFILSFGHYAEVLEPSNLRDIIHDRLEKSLKLYAGLNDK